MMEMGTDDAGTRAGNRDRYCGDGVGMGTN